MVISIIAVLAGMTIPAVSSARNRAAAAVCLSNLRQSAAAVSLYTADYRVFPTRNRDISSDKGPNWGHRLLDAGIVKEENWKAHTCSGSVFSKNRTNLNRIADFCFGLNFGFIKARLSGSHVYYPSDDRDNHPCVIKYSGNDNAGFWRVSSIYNANNVIMLADTKTILTDGTSAPYYKLDLKPAGISNGYLRDSHGNGKCNMAFWDGHAAALSPGQLEKILPRNASRLKNGYWGKEGIFAE